MIATGSSETGSGEQGPGGKVRGGWIEGKECMGGGAFALKLCIVYVGSWVQWLMMLLRGKIVVAERFINDD